MQFTIEVNNKKIKATKGETILSALKQNGMNVPTLCFMKDLNPTGACRICVVEVDGRDDLVPACSTMVEEWMRIKTHSPRVINARKTIVELLLSNHPDDCLYCDRNRNCELQTFAEELNIRERRIFGTKNFQKKDMSSPAIVRDPAKCILCGRCVRVCDELQNCTSLEFSGKGNTTHVGTTLNKSLNLTTCISCGQCILTCPTGALTEKKHFDGVQDAINNPEKTVVVQYDPSIPLVFAEEFGLKQNKDPQDILNAALQKIGFNTIFDNAFGIDVLLEKLAEELLNRKEQNIDLPMFNSCCPAWVKYAEQTYPKLLDNLFQGKSAQQINGTLIKHYWAKTEDISPDKIYNVSVMPCPARKFEGQRDEMTKKALSDIDAVFTARELINLIKLYGIDVNNLEPLPFHPPFSFGSSSARLYSSSGGLTEGIIRVLQVMAKKQPEAKLSQTRSSKSIKEFELKIGKHTYSFAVVSGISNANQLINDITNNKKQFDFIEVMACPGGCVNGGGMPITNDNTLVKQREKALYIKDEKAAVKIPDKNPAYHELKQSISDDLLNEFIYTNFGFRNVIT